LKVIQVLLLPNFQRSLNIMFSLPLSYLTHRICLICFFALTFSLSSSPSLLFRYPLFRWGCKGKSFCVLQPNFFFIFHNFLFTVFVAIFCVRASFKPGCKDKRFSFSLPNFFSLLSWLLSSLFSAYFIPPGVNFYVKNFV